MQYQASLCLTRARHTRYKYLFITQSCSISISISTSISTLFSILSPRFFRGTEGKSLVFPRAFPFFAVSFPFRDHIAIKQPQRSSDPTAHLSQPQNCRATAPPQPHRAPTPQQTQNRSESPTHRPGTALGAIVLCLTLTLYLYLFLAFLLSCLLAYLLETQKQACESADLPKTSVM